MERGAPLLVVGLGAALWSTFSGVGIWRSAGRYAGSSLWSVLARAYVAIDVVRSYLIVVIAIVPY